LNDASRSEISGSIPAVLTSVNPPTYIDAHNHFQDPVLDPFRSDLETTIHELPIGCMVVNGTTEQDWPRVDHMAITQPHIVPSYGLHPWFLKGRSPDWKNQLERFIAVGNAAVGETGLDCVVPGYDLDEQKEILDFHLSLANQFEVPTTIHCLNAWDHLIDFFKESPPPNSGLLLHAFGGPIETIDFLTDLGAYFSFSGFFLGEEKQSLQKVFQLIRADRLLVETDAPSMPLPESIQEFSLPLSASGERLNHPGNLRTSYRALAEIRGITEQRLMQIVSENLARLFGKLLK
jgi:TatD DNase family protein